MMRYRYAYLAMIQKKMWGIGAFVGTTLAGRVLVTDTTGATLHNWKTHRRAPLTICTVRSISASGWSRD